MLVGSVRIVLLITFGCTVTFYLAETQRKNDLYGSYHQAACVLGVSTVLFLTTWGILIYCNWRKRISVFAALALQAIGAVFMLLTVALFLDGANLTHLAWDFATSLLLLFCIAGAMRVGHPR